MTCHPRVTAIAVAVVVCFACSRKPPCDARSAVDADSSDKPSAPADEPEGLSATPDRDSTGEIDPEALRIWREFVAELGSGEWPDEKIRLMPELKGAEETVKQWLQGFRDSESVLRQFDETPRAYRVENYIHYLISITREGEQNEYCFSLLVEGDTWYFSLLEMLHLPIYAVPELPASSFPDVPEDEKHWRRAETLVTKDVSLWSILKEKLGEESAFNWFRDGRGYVVGTKVWLPFLPVHEAFVVIACWQQAVLWGDSMTLVALDDDRAVIRFDRSIYFLLYKRTGHLRHMISAADYKKIFETTWRSRCKHAGWEVSFDYRDDSVVVDLHLTRKSDAQ